MTKLQSQKVPIKVPSVFTKAGDRYIGSAGDLSVKVHQRKEYTKEKPRLYLMYSIQGQPAKYLTGLYPQSDGAFIGEKNGVYWRISLTDDAIEFGPIRGKEETPLE
jgi:hypothetical protein